MLSSVGHSSSHIGYRPDIDGLRALAVLGVLIYHAFPSVLTGGFIGVDVFFVISGYIISSNLYKSLGNGSFSFYDFYIRRIKRIFPALALVLGSVLIFGWFSLFPVEYSALGKHAAYGAGFVANFGYLGESGYFDVGAITKPLLHLWSLGIEEQFYFVWPIVLIAAWRFGVNLYIVLSVLLLISFCSSIYLIGADPVSAFYLPYSRFWELVVGAIIALWVHFHASQVNRFVSYSVGGIALANFLSALGLAGIGIGYVYAKEGVNFPGYWALLPTAGCGLIILAGSASWVNRKVLASRLLVAIGLISFPIYLWHWPLLSFAHIIEGKVPPPEVRAGLAVASIALGWATFKFVERPLRYGKGNFRTLGLVVSILCVFGFGISAYKTQGYPERAAIMHQQATSALMVGPTWKYTSNELCASMYPDTFRYFCSQEKKGPPTVILIGNSYANHLYGGLVEDSRFDNQNILSYGSCEPGGYLIDCVSQEKIVSENPSIKYAIVSELWPRLDAKGRMVNMDTGEPLSENNRAAQYEQFLNDKAAFMKSHGVQMIIFSPKPEITYDARTCVTRPFASAANSCKVLRSVADSQQAGINEVIGRVKEKNPEVVVFDQNGLFCDGIQCDLFKDGLPLLRDDRHYSEFGSRLIIAKFAEWAKSNVPALLQ